jgi:hypothetical protein
MLVTPNTMVTILVIIIIINFYYHIAIKKAYLKDLSSLSIEIISEITSIKISIKFSLAESFQEL